MRDPFKIEGPAAISFSGGRTSGLMLAKIVEAHGGTLPADVIPVFCNTGKEMPATLDFVEDCSRNFAPVVWLEYAGRDEQRKKTFRVVNHATASRNGEPFAKLIAERKYLPNPIARFCTIELKIATLHQYLRSIGWNDWTNCIGIRNDEPSRISKVRGRVLTPDETVSLPLVDARVTKTDVMEFWRWQSFRLNLPIDKFGDAIGGNCDLCFLKGPYKKIGLIRRDPSTATFWIEQEKIIGGRFRNDSASYAEMLDIATQPSFDFDGADDLTDCACTD